jgi:galactitol-specific phosphotransferase system IIB component
MIDAKGLKIIIVCTFGAGSSQLLKINVDSAIEELGVENVNISVCDSGSYRGERCDGIITTTAHEEMVQGHPYAKAYVAVTGIFNQADIKNKVRQILVALGVEIPE